MERAPGTKVRTYHGALTGEILGPSTPSTIDGSERVLVRWKKPPEEGGGYIETSWSPHLLVRADAPREQDPRAVMMFDLPYCKVWLTANGIRRTPKNVEITMLPDGTTLLRY